ncbi:MAG: TetR/AcrR family transcriptional repressor of nem operon [Cellvibrionaceae bacterium]|jgi:TetR/AcrR family transcriptional repressor of nem operon
MSRIKQYDRIELLNRAVELFRRQGFNGTSTAELVAELGVNRKSMYAEFGSKQQLFEAVLDHYNKNHLTRVLAPLEAPDASISAIKQAFYGYASAIEGSFRGLGCLMCNTASERGALDPSIDRYVGAYLERISRAFRDALNNAQKGEEIAPTVDLDEMAGFLTTTLIGVAASVRAEAPPAQVWATYGVVTKMVEGLSTTGRPHAPAGVDSL